MSLRPTSPGAIMQEGSKGSRLIPYFLSLTSLMLRPLYLLVRFKG